MSLFSMIGNIASSGISNLVNYGISRYNNAEAERREKQARKENYEYGEKAADAADARARAQYADIYSPSAQMQQLKEAGLSPSIYASGGLPGGQGVGAQGGSAGNVQPNVFGIQPVSPLDISQMELNNALANQANQNAIKAELDNEIKELENKSFLTKWKIMNNTIWGDENGVKSLTDIAKNCETYEDFEKQVFDKFNSVGEGQLVKNEVGQNELKNIYQNTKSLQNEIAILANSKENAQLILQITKLLNNDNFINESANNQLEQLKQAKENAKLNSKLKGALNRTIEKLGNGTSADIILTLLTIIGQYSHTSINLGANSSNIKSNQ